MKKTFLILPFFLLISSCMKSVGNIPNGKNPDAVGSCLSKDPDILTSSISKDNNDLPTFSCIHIDQRANEICQNKGKKLAGYKIERFELLAKVESRKQYEIYCE